ncbi:MAG TPA: molybdopterin cofactor-binding domain-containing protein, partial [Vicinamibacterales bacterium]|nr:molybdopterin cofactor-binding domain-containing protein [Vicinamibacterales bacterium]
MPGKAEAKHGEGLLRIGDAVPRFEDARLLSGQGRYTDDIRLDRQTYLAIVRSPHPRARIVSIDAAAAAAAPGVLHVITGRDLAQLGTFSSRIRRSAASGEPMFEPLRRVLPLEEVRYVGEAVAAVVAERPEQARDAAELVQVAYEPLPAAASIEAAVAANAPAVWPEVPDNIAFVYSAGDANAVDDAFARAKHAVSLTCRINRVTASPIEPRTALADCDRASGRLTLYASVQTPHALRNELCTRIFRIPASSLRVMAPDVGGAFGMKSGDYVEYALLLWCARVVRRPVRWT